MLIIFLKISAILLVGAFGGILHTLYYHDGKLPFPRKLMKSYNLGFWTDVILGMGAALLATLPIGIANTPIEKLLYLAILAGFGGGVFIAKQAKVTDETKDQLRRAHPVDPGTDKIEVIKQDDKK